MHDARPPSASTRPYLLRALHEWATDNGLTPYIAVQVDESVQVPREYVKDGEIVLNVSFDATGALTLGNEFVEFKARFGGVARQIVIPVTHVIAIYARENGQGMAFPPPEAPGGVVAERAVGPSLAPVADVAGSPGDPVPDPNPGREPDPPRPAGGGSRPPLVRVK